MYSGALAGTRMHCGGLNAIRTYRHQLPKSQWSIQSVKGKITGNCLWHAFKALLVGILLIVIGASMATVGYYADVLSMEEEIHGNVTVKVKNVSKGFHLTNLSYFGPIIMGFGGFVIVAACVMTFEARDSAAKIVPARFRNNKPPTCSIDGSTPNGHTAAAAAAALRSDGGESWEFRAASASLYPTACGGGSSGAAAAVVVAVDGGGDDLLIDRHALTTAFIQFSKNLQKSLDKPKEVFAADQRKQHPSSSCSSTGAALQRCPSAPTLVTDFHQDVRLHDLVLLPNVVINNQNRSPHKQRHHQQQKCCQFLLNPNVKRLQVNLLPRQAISVDNPCGAHSARKMADALQKQQDAADVHKTDSVGSMTMDLHFPDCSVTLTVKDESKRPKNGNEAGGSSSAAASSPAAMGEVGRKETAKRRPLMRQQQVEQPDSDSEDITLKS